MSTRYVILCNDCGDEADDGPYRRSEVSGVRRTLTEMGWDIRPGVDRCPECRAERDVVPTSE